MKFECSALRWRCRKLRSGLTIFFAFLGSWSFAAEAPSRGLALFNDYIGPLFRERCYECHSHEGGKAKGGLVLDSRSGWSKGGEHGPAIVPGKPEKSLMIKAVSHTDPDLQMPPKKKLSGEEIARLRKWIALGAPDPRLGEIVQTNATEHWAFRPIRRPPLPASRKQAAASRPANPIDSFITAKLSGQGLSLAREANRRTLIRRLSYDLIGLPPTPAEVEAFAADHDSRAYARLVERLLDSPHYGERWGRHWLDAAGFAESSMFIGDQVRPGFWRYRDYVIRAFNSDKPYDRFLMEQIAGDESFDWRSVETFTAEQIDILAATGFLRCPPDATDNQPITQQEKIYPAQQLAMEVSMKAVMGLSLNCVRCHSHKYDPIPHEDYYRLIALFQPAYDPQKWIAGIWSEPHPGPIRAIPILPRSARESYDRESRAWPAEEHHLQEQIKSGGLGSNDLAKAKARLEQIKSEGRKLPPVIWATFDVSTDPSPTHLLRRGEYEQPAQEISPGVLSALDKRCAFHISQPPFPGTTGRRLALARWLTHRDHPLTARVIVNRIWQYHFGTGIVATPDDFGARGAAPSEPDLLDWLACELMDHNWSIKHIHRLILNSDTYRQASATPRSTVGKAQFEKLLARFPKRRLEGEIVRDAMLEVAGHLDKRLFGESVPTQKLANGQSAISTNNAGRNRRSIYISTRRTTVPTFLSVFDMPAMDTNWPKRNDSVIPQQALALMNSGFVQDCAEQFAKRLLGEGDTNFKARLQHALLLAYGRFPDKDEVEMFTGYARENSSETAEKVWSGICHALLSSNEFLYVD